MLVSEKSGRDSASLLPPQRREEDSSAEIKVAFANRFMRRACCSVSDRQLATAKVRQHLIAGREGRIRNWSMKSIVSNFRPSVGDYIKRRASYICSRFSEHFRRDLIRFCANSAYREKRNGLMKCIYLKRLWRVIWTITSVFCIITENQCKYFFFFLLPFGSARMCFTE